MSPSGRVVVAVIGLAALALVLPIAVVLLAGVALVATVAVDALAARRLPRVQRSVPVVLSRGTAVDLSVRSQPTGGGSVRVRQPRCPGVAVDPAQASPDLDAQLVARHRGRHSLPPVAARVTGPLGLARWDHRAGAPLELTVFPDLPGARRLLLAVRRGRFRGQGQRTRGPLGLGTAFESVRDYAPDDDIRQVNWRATARLGRPMSNQFRVDEDRDVICMVDLGRLMAAPLGTQTRLDLALDAATAVAMVADEVGDRCGCIAFAASVRRELRPKRAGAAGVVRILFDLEAEPVDSDYERAFRRVGSKRAFVMVLTDLLEETAARPLLEAVPVLARRHVVVIVSAADDDLDALVRTPPRGPIETYAAAVAVDVLEARSRVRAQLVRAGATVVEAHAKELPEACVRAYLMQKARARL